MKQNCYVDRGKIGKWWAELKIVVLYCCTSKLYLQKAIGIKEEERKGGGSGGREQVEGGGGGAITTKSRVKVASQLA